MLKYLRDKLFNLEPTATIDLSRPLRHATYRATYVGNRASLIENNANTDFYYESIQLYKCYKYIKIFHKNSTTND